MADKIRFGVYELDREAMELRKHGVVLRLQEQPFRVLAMLAGRPGEIVTREELQEQIWGNTFVDFDQSLNKAINRVREALNDNAGTPQYVETVPRRGYRFIAPVADIEQAAVTPAALLTPALAVEPAQSRPHRSKSGPMMITALAIVSVLAALGIAAWLRQTPKSTVQEPRHITSAGTGPSLTGRQTSRVRSDGRWGRRAHHGATDRRERSGPDHVWSLQRGPSCATRRTARIACNPLSTSWPTISNMGAR
jgi:DNA-binding winged helix-turn-helix (wHTH) protein